MRKFATIAAAITLASAQVAAAAPAAPVTVAAAQRAGTATTNDSQLHGRGGAGTLFVSLAALTAIILGILAAAHNGTPRPTSPG